MQHSPPPFIRAIMLSAVGDHQFDFNDTPYGDIFTLKWTENNQEIDIDWVRPRGAERYWCGLCRRGVYDTWIYNMDLGIQSNLKSVYIKSELIAFPNTHYSEILYDSTLELSSEVNWNQYVNGILLPLMRHARNLEEEEALTRSGDDTDEEMPGNGVDSDDSEIYE